MSENWFDLSQQNYQKLVVSEKYVCKDELRTYCDDYFQIND